PAYGLVENTLMVSGASPDRQLHTLRVATAALEAGRAEPARNETERSVELVASGAVSDGQEVRIVDPEQGTPCADGRIGEIWVRGPSVARGYWSRPEETAAVFGARPAGVPGPPFLRTGDLGLLQQGQLYVTGRIKDLIIVAGRNHYPQDLELCVEQADPSVRAGGVAAFAVEHAERECLVIVAEVDLRRSSEQRSSEQRSARLAELVQTVRRAVALQHDLQPFAIWLLPPGALPKTSSGKLQRHLCRSGFADGTLEALVRWGGEGAAETEADADAGAEQPSVTAQAAALYPDIGERRRKIDRRHTRYRFDLERDIPWQRTGESGDYFGAGYLEMIGVNEPALRRHPEAYDACQWALALATCTSFITVEEYLLFFTQRERNRLGECRSLALFQEEEQKHIALFGRYAAALREQRPDLAARIQPHIERCNTAHQVATANASGMDDALFHYQFWLYALVLEEGSIHICDKLLPDAPRLQSAWLATHVAHRREEIQHVATDSVHVKALALSASERLRLSQMWFRHLANNWGYMHGVQAAHALLSELYPEVAAEAFPSPLQMPPRFLEELLTHRAFSNTRAAAPYLTELASLGLAAAHDELTRMCEQRGSGIGSGILPPAPSSIPFDSQSAASGEERRDLIKGYLLARISEATRVTPAQLVPSQHLLDAGIDSVAGAELAGQIERDLGVTVPFSTVFDSTIDDLIDHIASSRPASNALDSTATLP
ncbi:MAG: non-ribosomal peptide synthase, partial [Pseudomonadota bacterium]